MLTNLKTKYSTIYLQNERQSDGGVPKDVDWHDRVVDDANFGVSFGHVHVDDFPSDDIEADVESFRQELHFGPIFVRHVVKVQGRCNHAKKGSGKKSY